MSELNRFRCVVRDCQSTLAGGQSFFSFPKDKNRLNQWIENLQIENDISKRKRVCSRHFENKYIYYREQQGKSGRKLLSNKAVPTLYLTSTAKPLITLEIEILKCAIEKDHSCGSRKTNIPEVESANEKLESLSGNRFKQPGRKQKVLVSTSTQTDTKTNSAEIKPNSHIFIYFISTWDTNKKFFTKTGIPSKKILDAIVKNFDILKFKNYNSSDGNNIRVTKKIIKITKKRKIDKQKTKIKKIVKDKKKEELTSNVNKNLNINLPSEKKKTCQICRNKFSSHKELKHHFQEHGKKRTKYYKPTQYGTMIFSNQTKAIQHRHGAHPNVPNNFCQFCGKLFVLKNSLEEHLTKDHPNQLSPQCDSLINCDYCSASFSNATVLQYHVKSLHQQKNYLLACDLCIPPSSTKIIRSNSSKLFSTYYCHLCGIEYMIKNGLKKHLYEMHTPEERNTNLENCIRCKTCAAVFISKIAYDKHLAFHRPGDFYAANEEERIKVLSRVDQDFDISRVPLFKEINTTLKQMIENPILSHEMKSVRTKAVDSKIEPDIMQNTVEPDFAIDFAKKRKLDLIDKNNAKNFQYGSSIIAKRSKVNTKEEPKNSVMNTPIKNNSNSPIIISVETLNRTQISENKTETTSSNENISTSKSETVICNRTPKFIKKQNATMEIIDSQNKMIVLKKAVLKKQNRLLK